MNDKDGKSQQVQTDKAEITLKRRRPVFENRVYLVYADHISDKQGNEVEQYLSVVPKGLVEGTVSGVAVLPTHEKKSDWSGFSGILSAVGHGRR